LKKIVKTWPAASNKERRTASWQELQNEASTESSLEFPQFTPLPSPMPGLAAGERGGVPTPCRVSQIPSHLERSKNTFLSSFLTVEGLEINVEER
jgi:hypothetical protein